MWRKQGFQKGVFVMAGLLVFLVVGYFSPAMSAEPFVVSIWGGHWKEVIEKAASDPFVQKTGQKVEYDVGETTDRLARTRATKGSPQADIAFTTSHVARLYASEGLLEPIDVKKLSYAKNVVKEAFRSPTAIAIYATVYTIGYRTDMIKRPITSWEDLWSPELKGKVILPAFDPSHIIVMSALLSGGNEFNWEKGWEKLKALKDNVVAFYATGLQSIEMMRRGEAAVGVMNSPNIFRLEQEGVPVKLVIPKEKAIVTMDVVTILKGTKNIDAAHKYIDILLSPEAQAKIAIGFNGTPMNPQAPLPKEVVERPGIFTKPEQWATQAYIMDEAQRANMLDVWKERFRRDIMR
jgi:putative spermidine/putrescine transport system substrate-binding protein